MLYVSTPIVFMKMVSLSHRHMRLAHEFLPVQQVQGNDRQCLNNEVQFTYHPFYCIWNNTFISKFILDEILSYLKFLNKPLSFFGVKQKKTGRIDKNSDFSFRIHQMTWYNGIWANFMQQEKPEFLNLLPNNTFPVVQNLFVTITVTELLVLWDHNHTTYTESNLPSIIKTYRR